MVVVFSVLKSPFADIVFNTFILKPYILYLTALENTDNILL